MFDRFISYFRKDREEFLWALAEALMWRDESVSMAAIPLPIKEQPKEERQRYYADAKYIAKFVYLQVSKNKKVSP
jgi:hypothetical protein